ncbi:MAG TPA: diacylglycerol kinase [Steroidobacteraceae bacterium]|jgi:diacylglycerol kinase (ATP)
MDDRKNQPFRTRLRFALSGLAHAFRNERSLRTQAVAVALVFGVLLVLRSPPAWWALVLLATATVLAAELFNTALERLADHLHPQLHAEIRIVKDCAAAAVLCLALAALGVGIALLWQMT